MGRTLALRGVHVFQKVPNTNQFRLKEVHPYVRLTDGEEVVYIQDGSVYSGGGEPFAAAAVPAWFHEKVKTLNPAILRECGYTPREAPKK
jgi:hypothetical protein